MSDQAQQPTKVKAKGTKITESIIGAASNKMVSATKALNDAVNNALKLTATMDEQALKIADNEEKLQNLQIEYANKRTQQRIDLDLAFKADQKEFVQKYLDANELVCVNEKEYNSVISQAREWQEKFDEKVHVEVGKARGAAQRDAENEKKLLEANYQAKEAQNLARIQNLESQLAFATKQAETWEKQLNAERQASIERSKSQSATVNVAPQSSR